jgi:hypothetical protein
MKYWWVNQNQTYVHEVHGGYLWSPKTNANGARNRFYDAMTEVSPGDVIFSFSDTLIGDIGIVSGPHQSATKPTEFGTAGANWTNEGWYVPVVFQRLTNPIKPKDHMVALGPTLPPIYSPLQANGNGNQGVYLAPVPEPMAQVLVSLLQGQVEAILAKAKTTSEVIDNQAITALISDPDITPTQRAQLIQARIGQGLFKSRVSEIEPRCRVTGLADSKFLIASHIKPWAKSSDLEKLDGNNGLLLAPHVDHLFDKGYLTFGADGSLQLSPQLPTAVAQAWSIQLVIPATPLSAKQEVYMAYHRKDVFRA